MSKSIVSLSSFLSELHKDCLVASENQSQVTTGLASKRIAVTGGTGFIGSWIAQMVCTLNDEYGLNISLDLYARNTNGWSRKYPHLSGNKKIHLRSQDVRSPFEFENDTNFIIHAAGISDNRINASDPWRVQQTTVLGTSNALDAANRLTHLENFLNLSSCLVNGFPNRTGALAEEDCFPILSGKLHQVYVDAKRASESLAALYRSQFRLPICTLRPFTFIGPYQELDRPWAINSFLNDAIIGRDIRIHGDGSARRSYLYGSDVAFWILAALVKGQSGRTYNLGSARPVAHSDLVKLICEKTALKPKLSFNTAPASIVRFDDLFPNTALSIEHLGVQETCSLEIALDKTWRWNTFK